MSEVQFQHGKRQATSEGDDGLAISVEERAVLWRFTTKTVSRLPVEGQFHDNGSQNGH
jgi:hypothetical protein